jgi:two-component system KDP operon response regulator KdpE
MEGARILLVEDDPAIVKSLTPALTALGAEVVPAATGGAALRLLATREFDVVLADLGLPDMDGKDLIRAERQKSDVPIIVLSARAREQDRIEALDLGADDYVGKPYPIGELAARIRAALRRRKPSRAGAGTIRLDGLEVDVKERRVILDGEEIRLTGREHSLLLVLAGNAGNAVTHREIMDAVWGSEARVDTQHVRVLVGQLRQKIEEDPGRPMLLVNEPGLGYRLRAQTG